MDIGPAGATALAGLVLAAPLVGVVAWSPEPARARRATELTPLGLLAAAATAAGGAILTGGIVAIACGIVAGLLLTVAAAVTVATRHEAAERR